MSDGMPDPLTVAKEKFDHPIGGPILWSFMLLNWPVAIAILGAVKDPLCATETIRIYGTNNSILFMLGFPIIFGMIYAFSAPAIGAYFQNFQPLAN